MRGIAQRRERFDRFLLRTVVRGGPLLDRDRREAIERIGMDLRRLGALVPRLVCREWTFGVGELEHLDLRAIDRRVHRRVDDLELEGETDSGAAGFFFEGGLDAEGTIAFGFGRGGWHAP